MIHEYGLIIRPQKKHQWVAGSGKASQKLGADAGEINPKGDWTKYTTGGELQNRYGFETQNCTVYAILKAISALAKFKGYEIPHNLSERYNGVMAKTTPIGNDPWHVIENLATEAGVIADEVLPWSDTIRGWSDYYAPNPMDESIVALGQTILRKYEIEPEWIIPPINSLTAKEKNERIKAFLKRGTVVASVRAWEKKGGVYTKDVGAKDTHLVYIPKHGLADDQYEPFLKKLDPNYDYGVAIGFFMRPNESGIAPFERSYLARLLSKAARALQSLLEALRTPREVRFDVPIEPLPPEPVSVPSTVPVPVPQTLTNREHLYAVAKSCLGRDMAKTQNELGCAESVNAVHKLAFGKEIGGGASTAALLKALVKHPDFVETTHPAPGDIAINATGTSTKGAKNGHVGIWGNTHVMSNNSATYKWDAHYTHKQWVDYFEKHLGFPTRFFTRTGVRS